MKSQWTGARDEKELNKKNSDVKTGMMGDIPLLYGGMEFKALTLPADDVQYIQSNDINDREIYGMFRMPPTMVENWEKAPYNSSEQQDIVFAKYTLADIRGTEQELTEKLLPESNKNARNKMFFKFNLNGLLRGDSTTRANFYRTLLNLAAITPNMIADFEDLPTYEGGDKYYIQMNMIPVDMIADFVKSKSNTQQSNTPADTATREMIIEELRDQIKSRLNGHYKDVADILE